MSKKRLGFMIFILILGVGNQVQAYQLDDLMRSSNFARDQKLSKDIRDILTMYYVTTQSKILSNNDRKPYQAAELLKTGQLWKKYIKPECTRLKDTYATAMKERDFNDPAFVNVYKDFRSKFTDDVFQKCDQFEKMVTQYLTNKMQVNRTLPRALKIYTEDFQSIQNSPTVYGVKAFVDQSSSRYRSRSNQRNGLAIMLGWLKDFQPDHPQLNEWNSQFDAINKSYIQIAADNADKLFEKSALPSDIHAYDTSANKEAGNQLRSKITALMDSQIGQSVEQIILLGNGVYEDQERLAVKDGKLAGEYFDAIAFAAVVVVGEGKVSTHRGWYESVKDGGERLVLIEGDDNFGKPRVDQLVTTVAPKSAAQKRAEKDAAFTATRAKEKAAQDTAVDDEVAAFKAKAAADAAAALKAAQSMQGNVDGSGEANRVEDKAPDTAAFKAKAAAALEAAQSMQGNIDGLGSGAGVMSLISLFTTTLMIVAGLLVTRGPVSAILPANIGASLNQMLDKVSPLAPVLGLVLLGLALFGAVMNILSFALIGLVLSFVAAAAGLLLGMDQLLNFDPSTFKGSKIKAEKIKAKLQQNEGHIRMLQNYRTPIGFASLVIGVLMIIGIL